MSNAADPQKMEADPSATPFLDRGVDDWVDRLNSIPFILIGFFVPLAWTSAGADKEAATLWTTFGVATVSFVILYFVARRRGATRREAVGVVLIGRRIHGLFAGRKKRPTCATAAASKRYTKSVR